MSKARLVITAVVVEGRSQADVAREYQLSKGWVSKLVARYRAEGDAAFEPRSRRPKNSPTAIPDSTVELIVELRRRLAAQGFAAGADTIAWHLEHHHHIRVSRATMDRTLRRHGLVIPTPAKRPRSSYVRFQAEQPNEMWQADFTHYRLTTCADVEILSWLDDHARHALSVTAHHRVTGPIVVDTFRTAVTSHGPPASTLTDNGMVFTTRLSGGTGGRNAFETELRRLGITQKNSRPNHPTTCCRIEVDHVTLHRWVQRFTPLLVDAARPCRHAVGRRWFVDETYVKVAGVWRYMYRAVDGYGQVIDVYVSVRRDIAAARTFFTTAIAAHGEPEEVVTDRAAPLANVIEELLPQALHNTIKYANNRVECDHGRLKARLRPMRGLKTDRTATVIITGHAFIQNLRRGHYELGVDAIADRLRCAAAFDELATAI